MDICGDIITGPTGIEWICVAPPHEPKVIVEGRGAHGHKIEIPGHYYANRHRVENSH